MKPSTKSPSGTVLSAERGTQNELLPPREANVITAYRDTLADVLVDSDVRTVYAGAQMLGSCTWCQVIGAVITVSVYWSPAEIDACGLTESCHDCASGVVRQALAESLAASVVTVEIAGGLA